MSDVLDLLSRVNARLHVYGGRISGSLHVQRPWTHVTFRGGKGESVEDTLRRALKELTRRQVDGMPRTTQTAACSACASVTELRYLQVAKQWLCADCRKGLREIGDERRRAKRKNRVAL